MTGEKMARKAVEINFEIVVAHGIGECKAGFEWHGTFIHNPFVDPQYGAFEVDPVQQYGDAYLNSIFATDPARALEMAQGQLRDWAKEDLARYCVDHDLDMITIIENACGVRVPETGNPLWTLTDEQVARVWRHVEEIGKTTMDGS